ncbi:hypothetical protein HFD88_005681 [Aspergillus terreus]|nr:hypothetical protein HFD88_005681 [Aspergillus terreus]
MIAGAKRSLAECLDADELHSEDLHDNMYTGNKEGLGIVRENARMTRLEGVQRKLNTFDDKLNKFDDKLNKLDDELNKLDDELRETNDKLRDTNNRLSELHNAFNRQAQQTDVRLSLLCADVRNRSLSTLRRDFMGDESRENQKAID